jgi:hypothetical protein
MTNDFPVAGIQREGHADNLTVVAGNLESVRTPACIAPQRDHLAVMRTVRTLSAMFGEQQTVYVHNPIKTLVVDPGAPFSLQASVQIYQDATISERLSFIENLTDQAK